jgi:hypothetical protein
MHVDVGLGMFIADLPTQAERRYTTLVYTRVLCYSKYPGNSHCSFFSASSPRASFLVMAPANFI